MRVPPPLDVHSHLAKDIDAKDIRGLGAYIFAMTRSVSEYSEVMERRDVRTVWGVGVHPGLVRINRAFRLGDFKESLKSTPVVGEVGLDGASRVPLEAQVRVLREILGELQRSRRIISVHSSGAHVQVLRELHRSPVDGVILHWWTGSPELTEEAVRLGCYFSLPPAMMSSAELLDLIPLSRVLSETDHPYGDRITRGPKRPGGVEEVECRLGKLHQLQPREVRVQLWRNLCALVDEVGVRHLFSTEWRSTFEQLD